MRCTDEQQLTGDQRKTMVQLLRQIRGQIRDLRATLTAIETAAMLADAEARVLRIAAIAEADCARNERDCRRIAALVDDLTAHAYPTSFADVTDEIGMLWDQVTVYWPKSEAFERAEIDRWVSTAVAVGALLDDITRVVDGAGL